MFYIFGRIGLGIPVTIRTWLCPANHIVVNLMGTLVIVQSMYFVYTMVFILRARNREYAERKSKNIKMKWFTALTPQELSQIDAYNKKKTKAQ